MCLIEIKIMGLVMADDFYHVSDFAEANSNYKPYKERSDKKPVAEIIIELADGGGYLFPYAYKAVSKYSRKQNNDGSIQYAFTLQGGGVALLLNFENFSDEKFKRFLELISEHKVSKIYEFSGNVDDTKEPVIANIEEIQPNV